MHGLFLVHCTYLFHWSIDIPFFSFSTIWLFVSIYFSLFLIEAFIFAHQNTSAFMHKNKLFSAIFPSNFSTLIAISPGRCTQAFRLSFISKQKIHPQMKINALFECTGHRHICADKIDFALKMKNISVFFYFYQSSEQKWQPRLNFLISAVGSSLCLC